MDPKTYDQHQAIAPPLIAQLPPQVQVSMIPQVNKPIKLIRNKCINSVILFLILKYNYILACYNKRNRKRLYSVTWFAI